MKIYKITSNMVLEFRRGKSVNELALKYRWKESDVLEYLKGRMGEDYFNKVLDQNNKKRKSEPVIEPKVMPREEPKKEVEEFDVVEKPQYISSIKDLPQPTNIPKNVEPSLPYVPRDNSTGDTFKELTYEDRIKNRMQQQRSIERVANGLDKQTVNLILSLYRGMHPIIEISEKLNIARMVVVYVLKQNMSGDEYHRLKEAIQKSLKKPFDFTRMQRSLPEIVWQMYYGLKLDVNTIAKRLRIDPNKIQGILDQIKS